MSQGGLGPNTCRSSEEGFKIYGLTLDLHGSEGHKGCDHTFGKDYRTILMDQRVEWEDLHSINLDSLQLPVVQGNRQTTNSITNGSRQFSEKLAKNPKGVDKSTDDENDRSNIKAFNVLDLGDEFNSNI